MTHVVNAIQPTWQGGHRNHKGGFSTLCCTLSALTPDISPNLGNLTVLSMLVGGDYIHDFSYIYCFILFIIYIFRWSDLFSKFSFSKFYILNIINYFKMAAQEGAKSSRAFLSVEPHVALQEFGPRAIMALRNSD